MSLVTKFAKYIADRDRERDKDFIRFLKQHGISDDDDTPMREPPPPKPPAHSRYPAGSQEWFTRLPAPPSLEDDIANGRTITMNKLARSVPQPRPPRAPGTQEVRTNGFWSWWHR